MFYGLILLEDSLSVKCISKENTEKNLSKIEMRVCYKKVPFYYQKFADYYLGLFSLDFT